MERIASFCVDHTTLMPGMYLSRQDGEVRTWDDFYEAAKKVRATGSYITSDSGDAGFFDGSGP